MVTTDNIETNLTGGLSNIVKFSFVLCQRFYTPYALVTLTLNFIPALKITISFKQYLHFHDQVSAFMASDVFRNVKLRLQTI